MGTCSNYHNLIQTARGFPKNTHQLINFESPWEFLVPNLSKKDITFRHIMFSLANKINRFFNHSAAVGQPQKRYLLSSTPPSHVLIKLPHNLARTRSVSSSLMRLTKRRWFIR